MIMMKPTGWKEDQDLSVTLIIGCVSNEFQPYTQF